MPEEKSVRSLRALPWIAALVCAAITLLPAAAFGQDAPPITLSATTSAGIIYGEAFEYVYNQAVSANYKNSELDWTLQPLFYTEESLSLATAIGIEAHVDVKQGIPGNAGTMTDSDFLNGNGVRTHYSQSESYAERALLLDATVGYDLPIGETVVVVPYLGFSYMDFKWSARDGYYQYPTSGYEYSFSTTGALVYGTLNPWSASETETPLYGAGILYEQTYLIGSAGVRASLRLDRLTVGASFAFSPLTYCYDMDNHLLRQITFTSTLTGGMTIEPALSLQYAFTQRASLTLSVDYRQIFNLLGDATEVNQGTTATGSDGNYYAGPDSASTFTKGSGAAVWMLDASLLFRLEL